MSGRYKVLRTGISLKQDDGSFVSPVPGDIITLNELAAEHMLSEEPPYVELETTKRKKEMKEVPNA